MRFNIHRSPKLLIGAIALVLCCCTLVGGTLAWLTEGPLAISDGEVDAKLYWSSDLTDWQDAENGRPIFGAAQWEPGHTQIRYLKVSNAAELDFSYILSLDTKDPAGPLAQAIDVYCCEAPGTAFTSFSQLRAQADFSGTLQTVLDSGLAEGTLESGDAVYAVALHMRESAGNTFQGRTLENIRVSLDATLLTSEEHLAQLRREQALKEAISGKRLSILGDSISTFRGWSNNTSYNSTIGGNAVWYNGSNGVTDVNETWWMQTINRTGMELLVNNSWSGDTVTSTAKNQGISRSLQLHNNSGTTPDLIAVYFGINDFRYEVSVTDFAAKYDEMVKGMKEKYQNADIFLFTLVYTTSSVSNPYDVEYFNDAITATAAKYGCTLVDLYGSSGINADTMAANMHDGNLHPNYDGMDKITDCFMEVLMKKYVHAES